MRDSNFFAVLFCIAISSSVFAGPPVNDGEPISSPFTRCPSPSPRICPTGTPCPTCSSCPEPSLCPRCPSPSPSASPSITPPPIPECPSYKLDIVRLPGKGLFGGKDDILNLNDKAPECLSKMFDVLYAECARVYRGGAQTDDCIIAYLRGQPGFLANPPQEIQKFSKFIQEGYNANCSVLVPGWCDSGTSYFDESCNPLDVSKIDKKKSCNVGKLSWLGTPISLLMGSSLEDFSKDSNIVAFSLSPDANEYALWKASDKAPLLVFDPEHKGEITSASQLFGEWTFGGKARASLTTKTKSDATVDAQAWDNGFSALATLDSNMDGKIAGEELASLGLWFDANRDAVSDKGEVRSLSEVGIKTLYYKNTVKDSITADVVLSIGYEIETKGVLTQGIAVDWYGITAKSEVELLQRKEALASLCNSGNESSTGLTTELISDFASVNSVDPGFSGAWNWKSEEVQAAGGMLVFSFDSEGKFSGVSMFQLSLEDPSQTNFSKVVQMLKLSGSLSTDDSSKSQKLQFVHRGQDGTLLESQVELSEDRNHLKGRTTALEVSGDTKKMRSYYTWSAERHLK